MSPSLPASALCFPFSLELLMAPRQVTNLMGVFVVLAHPTGKGSFSASNSRSQRADLGPDVLGDGQAFGSECRFQEPALLFVCTVVLHETVRNF